MKLANRIAAVSLLMLGLPVAGMAGPRLNPLIALGVTSGGDTIGSYTESWWGYTNRVDVHAGESGFLYGGFSLVWPGPGYSARSPRVGVLLQGGVMDGGNGYSDEPDLDRNAVELLGIVEWADWRFGAGIARHLSPVLRNSFAPVRRIDFNDATGPVVQFEWLASRRWSIGMRYVDIDYESAARTVDASNVGFIAGVRFGRMR
jgi:hypothetical protein